MTARRIVIGIDVGTTTLKAVAIDEFGAFAGTTSAPNVWDVDDRGEVQVDMDAFADRAIAVLVEAARAAGEIGRAHV